MLKVSGILAASVSVLVNTFSHIQLFLECVPLCSLWKRSFSTWKRKICTRLTSSTVLTLLCFNCCSSFAPVQNRGFKASELYKSRFDRKVNMSCFKGLIFFMKTVVCLFVQVLSAWCGSSCGLVSSLTVPTLIHGYQSRRESTSRPH